MPALRRTMLVAALLLAGCRVDFDSDPDPNPTPTPTPSPTPSPSPSPTATPAPGVVRVDFSFAQGTADWTADYTDYTLNDQTTIDFVAGYRRLPAPLDARSGYYLAANNRSDDIFMYLSRGVTGLEPSRRYRVDTSVTFATNAPPGCPGAGGSPGESVIVKAGAGGVAPARVTSGSNVRLNLDKGNQASEGQDLKNLGTVAQSQPGGSCLNGPFQLKTLSTTTGPVVTADAQGRLWLVIGTDSGFEGFNQLYWLEGSVTLTPV